MVREGARNGDFVMNPDYDLVEVEDNA